MPKIAQIIPYKKLPRGMNYLDYLIPEELAGAIKIGSFVIVPFRAGKLLGLVAGFGDKSEYRNLKLIISIENSLPALPAYQIKLLHWFANYYYYSLSSALKLILPDKPKRIANVSARTLEIEEPKLNVNPWLARLTEQIYCSNDNNYLLFPENIEYKFQFFKDLCDKCLMQNKQILILFPQKIKIAEFYDQLSAKQKKTTVILTNEIHRLKNRNYSVWQQILENKKQIIIGTRSAIFAPLSEIALIVIDGAHSPDYKSWDQNPRYNSIQIAKKIQIWTGCKLILSSLSPRIEDAYWAKKQKAKSIKIKMKSQSKVQIINLKEEQKKGFTYLSDMLIENIQNTIKANKKVNLIVNKKGAFSYLYCADCKKEASCPHCQLPLTIDNEKELACYHCYFKIPIYLVCPHCKNPNLKKLGVGLESIKADVKKRFNSGLISVMTGQSLNKGIWPNVGLLGYIYIDSFAYLSDFNSNFGLYCLIKEINALATTYGENPKIILQTCFPENIAIKYLNSEYKKIYCEEIASRRAFSYPPFSNLIKIFFQHHDLKVCEKEAASFHQILMQKLGGRAIKITEPYLYYRRQIRGRYRCQMAIFLPALDLKQENILRGIIPDYWTIDKDPISLL